ncbi:MAG TPA: PQQ-dependent sugar dehydrogenase, partial [Acetobacteraceae bacterium]
MAQTSSLMRSEQASFRVTTFATGLDHPWGIAFLPEGGMQVTERPGRLRQVGMDGQVSAPIRGVPEVVAAGQGGLLDVALSPDFAQSRLIYLCHSARAEGGTLIRVTRARLDRAGLEDLRRIIDAGPPANGANNWGCRIVFDGASKLYLSTGDRFNVKMRSQRLDDLAGKILRLEPDGRPAEGNPFIGKQGARPEIYTLGHR